MPLELPHTAGCLVCGPGNSKGLRLRLFVDPETGIVQTHFSAKIEHIGFEGVAHGGVIATVMDEVMVWAASWSGKRFCLCGEMTVRYRRRAEVGQMLICTAKVESARSKLISTIAGAADESGRVIATAIGKYVPLSDEDNGNFLRTLLDAPATAATAELMRRGANADRRQHSSQRI
jgi:acyl-coenzyme A thioesterase PaaI-like protein